MKIDLKSVLILVLVVLVVLVWQIGKGGDECPSEKTVEFPLSSKEYASMGGQMWNAFQCSMWSQTMGNINEGDKLFQFGYEQGQQFLGALRAKKISNEDLKTAPMGVLFMLQGPSDEFILGRIAENVQAEAYKDVAYSTYDRNRLNQDSARKALAENEFQSKKCNTLIK